MFQSFIRWDCYILWLQRGIPVKQHYKYYTTTGATNR